RDPAPLLGRGPGRGGDGGTQGPRPGGGRARLVHPVRRLRRRARAGRRPSLSESTAVRHGMLGGTRRGSTPLPQPGGETAAMAPAPTPARVLRRVPATAVLTILGVVAVLTVVAAVLTQWVAVVVGLVLLQLGTAVTVLGPWGR